MTETSVPGTAVAPTNGVQLPLLADADFQALLEGADFVKGFTLMEKPQLVGKAFIITRVKYHPGKGGYFVSCEAVTQENSSIVFNDSSTGIRRQVNAYLTAKGLIDPGKGNEDGPADGSCRYDNPPDKWAKGGKEAMEDGFDIRLVCARGLRVSEYEWQGDITETWYLA